MLGSFASARAISKSVHLCYSIDAVLVSHNHYHHLDLPTLRALAQVHAPRFVVPLGNRALLEREGTGPVTELERLVARLRTKSTAPAIRCCTRL